MHVSTGLGVVAAHLLDGGVGAEGRADDEHNDVVLDAGQAIAGGLASRSAECRLCDTRG